MAQIPKYPYRVNVIIKHGNDVRRESHNYENLAGAWAYREIILRRPNTKKVEILIVLDESTPAYPT